MKKRVHGRKLSRGRGARKALFRGLIKALVEHGQIETTKVKAKFVQGEIDKIVTLTKTNTLAARRRVYAKLGNDRVTTDKLFNTVAKTLSDRNSGYTKFVHLPRRKGDNAPLVRLMWSKEMVEPVKKVKSTKKVSKTIKTAKRKVKKDDLTKTKKSAKEKATGPKQSSFAQKAFGRLRRTTNK